MSSILPTEEKKSRSSFWGKLFGTSKKSNRERKDDDSFQRQSSLYHSFHFTSAPQESSDSQEEAGNFTTLESSDFMDMQKDAGIIFLNKNSIVFPKEEDKHVQFAPTPMNKYYKVDVKAAPSKKSKSEENKENLKSNKTPKPGRPILRRSKENLSHKESLSDPSSNLQTDKIKVNVSYIDGPQVKKTPVIPRTSTKIALFDRKNGSLPHLNISGIGKYGSLPRTAKEKHRAENVQYISSDNTNGKLFFPPSDCNQVGPAYTNFPKEEFQKRIIHREQIISNCFSIPNLPRQVDQKRFLLQERPSSKQSRYSLGEPLRCGSAIDSRNLVVCYDPNCLKNHSHMSRQINTTTLCAETTSKVNFKVPNKRNELKGTSTQLPNKAINEIGIPIATHKRNEQQNQTKNRSRSESPHYIPLSETYTSDKASGLKKSSVCSRNSQPFRPVENFNFPKPNIPQQSHNSLKNTFKNKSNEISNDFPGNQVLRPIENKSNCSENPCTFMSQARKQAIRSSMYVQRKKYVNKLCKYKSKECEDGFSSMADDECSFNCSCSSCVTKFSRQYRKNMNKNTLGLTEDDKYFFTQVDDPDPREINRLPSVPEVAPTEDDPLSKTVEVENVEEQAPNTTWYECNDSLCKTPAKTVVSEEKQSLKIPDAKAVEKCIYENITQIINSATKQNFKTQDVVRMFSTPVSTSKFKKQLERSASGKKIARVLFSPLNDPSAPEKDAKSPAKSPIVFSDSVILLQEIFQKLSQECKELLQPDVSVVASNVNAKDDSSVTNSGSKYINNLVKNLRSKDINEGDFANIIGGIAQNIFLEAKLKSRSNSITQSASLPDLTKNDQSPDSKLKSVASVEDMIGLSNLQSNTAASDSGFKTEGEIRDDIVDARGISGDRHLPDGWSKSPTPVCSASTSTTEKSSTDKDNSRSSESEMQLLEDVIRLGMGLTPISKVERATFIAASPAKASRYKSRDVLSGKGKLKLKIYHNSGLVTVHVIRGAKLNRLNGRELNAYIKISMVPDSSKRVHWRTSVQKGQKNPVFNQKFSFEILAEDATKRLVFSVWHRDLVKERSELVGCMSFSIRHVLDGTHKINGWYRLLREGFGTQKHFAAHVRKNPCIVKKK
ncbi:uncharacterized protein TNCT_381 [Trichonephila clavata]|uniref:C2 domain-containing protein n=1 Tax=Trichonephila clavata TaxID=2740835 RepID=A0A8X6HEY8_TRICU|nr:uncharacterized protein TNCT_381 [Trichonephila clavata]